MAEMTTPDGRKLVYVDGFKIRNFLDDEFGIVHDFSDSIGYYSPRFYIPKNEIWVDWRYKDETEFLIKVLDMYNSPDFQSYAQLREAMKRELCKNGPVPEFKTKEENKDGLNIVYVDGKIIREYIDPEFILGGHKFVYDYVPEGEVWIDNKMDPGEIPYILLHELTERELMSGGKNYNVAHEYATVADKEERRAKAGARYPGDADYPWYGKSNGEIIKQITKS